MLDAYLYIPLREWILRAQRCDNTDTSGLDRVQCKSLLSDTPPSLYRTWLTPLLVTEYVTEMVALNTRNFEKGRLNILLRRRRYLAHITSTYECCPQCVLHVQSSHVLLTSRHFESHLRGRHNWYWYSSKILWLKMRVDLWSFFCRDSQTFKEK